MAFLVTTLIHSFGFAKLRHGTVSHNIRLLGFTVLRHRSLSHNTCSLLHNQASSTNCRSAPALQDLVHIQHTVWTSINTWDHINIPPVKPKFCITRTLIIQLPFYQWQWSSSCLSTNDIDHPAVSLPTTMIIQLTLPMMTIIQLTLPTTTTTSWLYQHWWPSAVSNFDDYSTSL